MLRRHEEAEGGTAWSNSSESSDDSSSPQPSLGTRHTHKTLVAPELQAAAPSIHISFSPRDSTCSSPAPAQSEGQGEEPDAVAGGGGEEDAGKGAVPNGHARYSRSLSHISESSVDGALTDRAAGESVEPSEVTSLLSGISVNDIEMEMPARSELMPVRMAVPPRERATPAADTRSQGSGSPRTEGLGKNTPPRGEKRGPSPSPSRTGPVEAKLDSHTHSDTHAPTQPPTQTPQHAQGDCLAPGQQPEEGAQMYRAHLVLVEAVEKPGDGVETESSQGEGQQAVDSGVEEALGAVVSSLDDYRGQFPELQLLEQELRLLENMLTVSYSSVLLFVFVCVCVYL